MTRLFGEIDRYLEGERLFALGLPPDDDDTDTTEQTQNDTGHHDARVAGEQLVETVSQDNTEYSDENRCRERRWREDGLQRCTIYHIYTHMPLSQIYLQITAVVM